MKKIVGFLFIVCGLVLIGIGSYDGFEKFEKELTSENESKYTGLYLSTGDSIIVNQVSEEKIRASINAKEYEFTNYGDYYENEESGFYIKFIDDELRLFKDGEMIKTLYKEKK